MYRQLEKTCPQYGELRPTIGWDLFRSLGTPANVNGFRVLVSLLQQRRSPEANQPLHDVWPCPGLLHVYTFSGTLAPDRILPGQNYIYFTSKSCIILYWHRYCSALQQRASAKLCGVVQGMELQNFRRGRHLYSAGRPSRWASAHILVEVFFIRLSLNFDLRMMQKSHVLLLAALNDSSFLIIELRNCCHLHLQYRLIL